MLDGIKALYQVMRDAEVPRPVLEDLTHARLQGVLSSAYQSVPYYRDLMQSLDYDPRQDYRGPEDLRRFPVTTKRVLRGRETKEFLHEEVDPAECHQDATSGSSGIPLKVYRNRYERALQMAAWLRVLFKNRYSPTDKVLSFTAPSRLNDGRSMLQRFGLLRREAVDYCLSAEEMTDRLLAYQPQLVYGNRAQLDLVAWELQKRGVRPAGLKALIGGAEVIHERNRQLYRESFGLELAEFYGSVEMGTMAYETPEHDGLRLSEDLIYFEFLDDRNRPVPPGQPGRVVVTDLRSTTMPFIRYDQGDLAIIEERPHPLGHTERRLVEIIGRDEDFLKLPDGTKRAYQELYEIMHRYPEVRQFRFVEKRPAAFEVLLVMNPTAFECMRLALSEELQSSFSGKLNFEVFRVDHLGADANGKFKRVISEVS